MDIQRFDLCSYETNALPMPNKSQYIDITTEALTCWLTRIRRFNQSQYMVQQKKDKTT